jgi:nucleoid-associated protein YgaU
MVTVTPPARQARAAAAPAPTPSNRAAATSPALVPPAGMTAPAPAPAAETAAAQESSTVVTVPAGSSLSDLMLAVYGQYNSQMMERVQAVNPQVTDPDVIIAGDRLRFPDKTSPAPAAAEAR